MRCKDLKNRLNSGSLDLTEELAEHLGCCPRCARAYESAAGVARLFKDQRSGQSVPSLSDVRRRVEGRAARMSHWENIMSNLKYELGTRPRQTVTAVVTVAVILTAVLIPFSYTRTVGYELSFTSVDVPLELQPHLVNAVVSSLLIDDVQMVTSTGSSEHGLTAIRVPTREMARGIGEYVKAVSGDIAQVNIKPVLQQASGSLYAQVAEKVKERTAGRRIKMTFERGQLVFNGENIQSLAADPLVPDHRIKDRLNQILNDDSLATPVAIEVTTDELEDYRIIRLDFGSDSILQTEQGEIVVMSDDSVALRTRGGGAKDSDRVGAEMDFRDEGAKKLVLQGRPIVLKIELNDPY
jgi:hypothetical protein